MVDRSGPTGMRSDVFRSVSATFHFRISYPKPITAQGRGPSTQNCLVLCRIERRRVFSQCRTHNDMPIGAEKKAKHYDSTSDPV